MHKRSKRKSFCPIFNFFRYRFLASLELQMQILNCIKSKCSCSCCFSNAETKQPQHPDILKYKCSDRSMDVKLLGNYARNFDRPTNRHDRRTDRVIGKLKEDAPKQHQSEQRRAGRDCDFISKKVKRKRRARIKRCFRRKECCSCICCCSTMSTSFRFDKTCNGIIEIYVVLKIRNK